MPPLVSMVGSTLMDWTKGGGGCRGMGTEEKRGQEKYGEWEKGGGKWGGEISKNCTTLHNILQSKKGNDAAANKNGEGLQD